MEQYRTEEEQVEALRRWWDENGRSMVAAVVIALAAGFGWQAWKGYDQEQKEAASDAYQAMIKAASVATPTAEQRAQLIELAEVVKTDHADTTYAHFAALHLARLAVQEGNLAEAEAQLRWVLGTADKGSDTALVAQLRLARVLAAAGDAEQALGLLDQSDAGDYLATYAMARGDVLLMQGRRDEARTAYETASLHITAGGGGQANASILQQKLQSLSPTVSVVDQGDVTSVVDTVPGGTEGDNTTEKGD